MNRRGFLGLLGAVVGVHVAETVSPNVTSLASSGALRLGNNQAICGRDVSIIVTREFIEDFADEVRQSNFRYNYSLEAWTR